MERQVIGGLLVAIVLGLLLVAGSMYFNRLQDRGATAENRGEVVAATDRIIRTNDEAEQERVKVDLQVHEAKREYVKIIEEAKKNEPETRKRADNTVPDSVRNAFRARRQARERSDGDN